MSSLREPFKLKQRRNRFRMSYDVLKALVEGYNTKSKLYYSQNLSYKVLTPLLTHLIGMGLISSRDATEDEIRRDKRSKWYLQITKEGRLFLKEIDALDKRYDGILLE